MTSKADNLVHASFEVAIYPQFDLLFWLLYFSGMSDFDGNNLCYAEGSENKEMKFIHIYCALR